MLLKLFHYLFPSRFRLSRLEKKLKYRFQDPSLLIQALSHRSYVNSVKKPEVSGSNERLEFLGDAVLDLVITEYLYNQYSNKDEGSLSKMKSLIVSGRVLEVCARGWDLSKYVLLSYSEKNAGGADRESILSDTYEAVLGAIYIDGGLVPARKVIIKSVIPIIDEVLSDTSLTNYKSELLELTQSRGLGTPMYHVIKEWGPEHQKKFCVGAFVREKEWGRGEGFTKKAAEQSAGRNSMEKIKNNEIDDGDVPSAV